MAEPLDRLSRVLATFPRLTIAVSGGVDSLTLAFIAERIVPDFHAIHAVSPAVPPAATRRVRDYAQRYGWALSVINSHEFSDPDYRANPYDRCYFCKNNLYATMAATRDGPLASGTNLDDLGEHRPGLIAAEEHGVRHPFVEAGIDKAALRRLAAIFGLQDIAELPAQPCLASRIMTGLHIEPEDLRFIDQIEQQLRIQTQGDLRCRITPDGVVIEADTLSRDALAQVQLACDRAGKPFAGHRPYRRGSAFVPPKTAMGQNA